MMMKDWADAVLVYVYFRAFDYKSLSSLNCQTYFNFPLSFGDEKAVQLHCGGRASEKRQIFMLKK